MKKITYFFKEAFQEVFAIFVVLVIMPLSAPWYFLDYFLQYRRGFIIESHYPREPGDGIMIKYIEKDKSIMLLGEDSDFIIRVPSQHLWLEVMPDWAKFRKNEITERIKQRESKSKFIFQETDDVQDAKHILCSDEKIVGDNKVFRIID